MLLPIKPKTSKQKPHLKCTALPTELACVRSTFVSKHISHYSLQLWNPFIILLPIPLLARADISVCQGSVLAHTDCPLPAYSSLTGVYVGLAWGFSQGVYRCPGLAVLMARTTWGAFINPNFRDSPRHGRSEYPPGQKSFGMREVKGCERHTMHKCRPSIRSQETESLFSECRLPFLGAKARSHRERWLWDPVPCRVVAGRGLDEKSEGIEPARPWCWKEGKMSTISPDEGKWLTSLHVLPHLPLNQ